MFFTISGATNLVSYDVGKRAATTIATLEGGNVSACWVSSTEVAYSSLQAAKSEILWADVGNGTRGVLLSGNASFATPIASAVSSKLAYLSDVVPPNQYGREYIGTYEPGDYNLWVENLDGSNNSYQYGMVPMAGSVHTWTLPWQLYPCPYTPGTISLAQDLSWSPDGRVIGYIAYDSELVPQLYLWDVIQWASTIGPVSQGLNNSTDPAWGPDSVSLAFASVQGGYYHIFVMNTTNVIPAMPPAVRGG
jgi:Tol biopolymer transport system component